VAGQIRNRWQDSTGIPGSFQPESVAGLLRIFHKAQRDVILAELNFSLSGCADESCQLEVGKMLAAEYIVVGDVSKVGSRYILNTKMIETESSRTVNTAKGLFSSIDELLDNIDKLAKKLSNINGENEPIVEDPVISEDNSTVVEDGTSEDFRTETDMETKTEEVKTSNIELIEQNEKNSPEIITAENQPSGKSSSFNKIAAYTTLGVGTVAAIAGGILIYNALLYKTETVDPAYYDAYLDDNPNYGDLTAESYFTQKYAEYTEFFDIFKNKNLLAVSLTGGGILSLAASALLFLLPSADQTVLSGTDRTALFFNVQPVLNGFTVSFDIQK
jgi:hypothetical protein